MDSPSLDDVKSNHGIAKCDRDQGNSSFSSDNSSFSIGSSSSDFMEDAASSPASSSELDLNGSLFELSELMAHLPIKRGLSKHFQGKSQSFTSLANVRCLEDLAKRVLPYRKRIVKCKSNIKCGLFCNKPYTPKACTRIISKKSSRVSLPSFVGKRSSIGGGPPIHVQKKF
ncbi:hypothetical protein AAC387_Pa02g2696 [Persea americana]